MAEAVKIEIQVERRLYFALNRAFVLFLDIKPQKNNNWFTLKTKCLKTEGIPCNREVGDFRNRYWNFQRLEGSSTIRPAGRISLWPTDVCRPIVRENWGTLCDNTNLWAKKWVSNQTLKGFQLVQVLISLTILKHGGLHASCERENVGGHYASDTFHGCQRCS